MEEFNNVPVQEPETTVETKKKKKINLEKPELFMLLAVVVANGVVPFATSFLNMIFSFFNSFLVNQYNDGFVGYDKIVVILNSFSSLTSSIYAILTSVLSIAAVMLIAYFAFKRDKLKNAAAFLGVYFVAQNFLQVFIERPVSYVLSFIVTVFNSIAQGMQYEGMDYEIYDVVSAVTGFVGSSLQFVVDLVCLLLTAVAAIVLLRIVNGKLKINFKKKKKEEKAEEIQENA